MNTEPSTLNSRPSTSSDDVLVRVEGISKKFCRSLKKSLWYGLQDIGKELMPISLPQENSPAAQPSTIVANSSLRSEEFWAVRDVSFELAPGESLGLIGFNGAGKTTLLKMLNGLIKPDTGSITMKGRVGALIALGAGFNPILTGRENILVNGAILGFSKDEIQERLLEIIDFSGIGDFIDAPVQSYSSGMQVRLGFSIATVLEPEILLVDEVLAVGDTNFRMKSFNRIGKLQKSGTAIILVSHNEGQIARFCSKALFLEKGKVRYYGAVQEGLKKYREKMGSVDTSSIGNFRYESQKTEKLECSLDIDLFHSKNQIPIQSEKGVFLPLILTVKPDCPNLVHMTLRLFIDDETAFHKTLDLSIVKSHTASHFNDTQTVMKMFHLQQVNVNGRTVHLALTFHDIDNNEIIAWLRSIYIPFAGIEGVASNYVMNVQEV